jgi:hypothetical protein
LPQMSQNDQIHAELKRQFCRVGPAEFTRVGFLNAARTVGTKPRHSGNGLRPFARRTGACVLSRDCRPPAANFDARVGCHRYQASGSQRYRRANSAYSAGCAAASAAGCSKKCSLTTAKNSAGSVAA